MPSAQPTMPAQDAAPAASATASATQPSASTQAAASAPSAPSLPRPAPVKPGMSTLAECRQLTLENGRIIDLPIHLLRGPPPRPTDFLHLQHYFEARPDEPMNLSQCKTADEAIDLLADEIEAIRLLLYGYILNFKQYAERFEEAHEDLRKEVMSVAESYEGLGRLIVPAADSARRVEQQFLELKRKINTLPVGGGRKPPKILRRRGPVNAPLSPEENRQILTRQGKHQEESAAMKGIARAQKNLSDAALLKEVLDPSPPATDPQPEAAKPFPMKVPFDHTLTVKINKVVDNVDKARNELFAAQAVTSQNLAVLRYLEDETDRDAKELWTWYDMMQRCTMTAGRLSEVNKERVEAFTKWADKCAEDAAAFARPAASDAPDAAQEASENQAEETSHEPPTKNGDATESPPSACPTSLPVDGTPAEDAPPSEGDVYAVTLEVTCEKPYDELTREEAIAVLKSLPLRVQFMPFAYPKPAGPQSGRCNGDDVDMDTADEEAKSAAPAQESACSPAAANAVGDIGDEAASQMAAPASPVREQRATKPNSRKRTRRDDDADPGSEAVEDDADARRRADGSPVKRKRGGQ
ncbi:hypothetical protein OH77DRAFT_1084891 [Trametes cingulata]|nr:hypothetical protein OH77DRAFT_1084891 [Trametes cingulata]